MRPVRPVVSISIIRACMASVLQGKLMSTQMAAARQRASNPGALLPVLSE